MNAATHPNIGLMAALIGAFLVAYGVFVVYLFTHRVNGRRRRWVPLDFVWVPMGGLTGALMLSLLCH